MKKLMISPFVYMIFLAFVIFFTGTTHVIAGAALTDFSRNGSRVSLSVVAWSEAAGVANPCYGYSSCYIGPEVSYTTFGIGGLSGSCDSGACIRAEDLPTLADVAERYKKKHPLPYTAVFNIDHLQDTSSCVGMTFIGTPSYGGHAVLLPGSTCTVIPPDNSRCSIDIPPYIEHGTLPVSAINGNTASVTGSAVCNFDGEAVITTSADGGTNSIYLNGVNLTSQIEVNGHNATEGIVFNVLANQPSTLTFTSTLRANGLISSGEYSGTAIVYVNYN
ncbi:hypothetical protein [Rahnella sp. ChDrAdgB13]|uniref:MrpH family fimbial adhesin n=1 Tax=Rahnella sp. ChDrAdgB13 TaxID=1850581 RepID=UPI001AD88231|nr:hypothetical protein [Rahnella sp. ChDrAdgB13]